MFKLWKSHNLSVSVRKCATISVRWEPPDRLRRESSGPLLAAGAKGWTSSSTWRLPALSRRREAIGRPGPVRALVERPGDPLVELLAQRDSGPEETQARRGSVQVQVIPGRPAFEAFVDM